MQIQTITAWWESERAEDFRSYLEAEVERLRGRLETVKPDLECEVADLQGQIRAYKAILNREFISKVKEHVSKAWQTKNKP